MGSCALIDPNWGLTEEFGVMVGHTLVDATSPLANVLLINLGEDEVVLPLHSNVGTLVPVMSVSVARSVDAVPELGTAELPEYHPGIPPFLGGIRSSVITGITA